MDKGMVFPVSWLILSGTVACLLGKQLSHFACLGPLLAYLCFDLLRG